jgi:hypothetical protein
MSTSASDPGDAARAALAELLGSTDIDITAEVPARLPSGEEVRVVYAAVRGEPNRTASVVVDAEGAVYPPQHFEALHGRDALAPEAGAAPSLAPAVTGPVTIDPPANDLTLPECVTEEETVTVHVPGVRPQADVYLLADTTGSMISVIPALRSALLNVVIPAFAGWNVAWGVGNYKDLPVEFFTPYAFQPQLAPTTDVVSITGAIGSWSAGGGGDVPEAQLLALQDVATEPGIGWRPGSKRILVWFGDQPGHDPICTAASGLATATTEATAISALQTAEITVVAVSTPSGPANPAGLDGDPTAGSDGYGGRCPIGGTPGQASRIAAHTGGSYAGALDAGALTATLASLISSSVPSINNLVLQPTGAIVPFVTSITPPSYTALAGDVPHTLPFQVTWTGVADCADKDQVFTGSLEVVADGVVVAAKPVRITVPACRWHHSVEMICGTQRGGDEKDPCLTVVDGTYATAVTIYNPTTCVVTIDKYFAPLVLRGQPFGREPKTVQGRHFARIRLAPGAATMDDCCSLAEVVGRSGLVTLGVLDIVADHALDVTVTHTANGTGTAATSVSSRTIKPRRA